MYTPSGLAIAPGMLRRALQSTLLLLGCVCVCVYIYVCVCVCYNTIFAMMYVIYMYTPLPSQRISAGRRSRRAAPRAALYAAAARLGARRTHHGGAVTGACGQLANGPVWIDRDVPAGSRLAY